MMVSNTTNKVRVLDNGDGTRSLKSLSSDKLIVTFRAENQDYDKKLRQQFNSFTTQSPLKKSCSLSMGINQSDPRLPQYNEVYICDNCSSNFESLQHLLVSTNPGIMSMSIVNDINVFV